MLVNLHNHVYFSCTRQALHYKKYSTASDVWSYGAVMYEIWSMGHKPYEDLSNAKVYCSIVHHTTLTCTCKNIGPPPGSVSPLPLAVLVPSTPS